MKYVVALATLLVVSCTNSETIKTETNESSELDSVLTKSEQNLAIVGGANQKSDSLVTGKVEHTVQKITHLETEVKQLKAENNELKDKLDDATDDGKPYSGLPISGN
jgi:peptidoglycan hydrolase CwlO-like protein